MADKAVLWDALYRGFFHRYVDYSDTVLDLAVGSCEFINAARVRRKIAVDLNPDTASYATDAEVVIALSDDLSPIDTATIDVVFTSNFFEHLPDKRVLLSTLAECHRVLRLEGLRLSGFQADEVIPRFLPYTVKGAPIKVRPGLVRADLRMRPVWRLVGRQMFVVLGRPEER